MAEYIEREAAIEAVEAQCVDGKMYGRDDGEGTLVDAYDIIDAISDAPAADVVEVVGAGSASIRRTKGSCGFVSIQTNIVIAGQRLSIPVIFAVMEGGLE